MNQQPINKLQENQCIVNQEDKSNESKLTSYIDGIISIQLKKQINN